MFNNTRLITEEESGTLFQLQEKLINEYKTYMSTEILIKIALLQTVIPICDYKSAVDIMLECMVKEFDLLIIGTYLNIYCDEMSENIFLNILIEKYDEWNNNQKSIVRYLEALDEYHKNEFEYVKVVNKLNESISLCNEYVSNYYLRYLIMKNTCDKNKAIGNVEKVSDYEEIALLGVEDFINPDKYIDEFITMKSISIEVYKGIKYDS